MVGATKGTGYDHWSCQSVAMARIGQSWLIDMVKDKPHPFSSIKFSHHLAKGCYRPVSTLLQRKGLDPDSPFKPGLRASVANLKLLSIAILKGQSTESSLCLLSNMKQGDLRGVGSHSLIVFLLVF